jgi:hypothetical protein
MKTSQHEQNTISTNFFSQEPLTERVDKEDKNNFDQNYN